MHGHSYPSKTPTTPFVSNLIYIDSKTVLQVKEHRVLGITIDDEFKWQSHVSRLIFVKQYQKIFSLCHSWSVTSVLKPLKSFIVHTFFHILASLQPCGMAHLNKLNSLHRRAAKLLLPDKNSSTDENTKALSIGLLPLQKQLYFNKAVPMFKVNRRMTPSYIVSLFTESNNRINRYVLPKPRIHLCKTSLSFSGSFCWNLLPVAIKTVGTIKSFERVLHQYLMWQ